MRNFIKAIRGIGPFLRGVAEETSKSTWPERRELWESTLVIITATIAFSAYIGLCDWILLKIVRLMLPLG